MHPRQKRFLDSRDPYTGYVFMCVRSYICPYVCVHFSCKKIFTEAFK